ncbi:MAG TPA: metallophosphoesterase family protein, partial [Kiritimatiellia bacterium]
QDYLRKLKYVAPVETFTIVHSTLDTPEMWGYVFDKLEAEANFNYQTTAVCFYGHTHVPLAFEKSDTVRFGLYSKIKVTLGKKYFINVGSVGQPRDGDPRAAYVIYDMINNIVELRRVPYDIQRTQKKILDAGLPGRIAARLAVGR